MNLVRFFKVILVIIAACSLLLGSCERVIAPTGSIEGNITDVEGNPIGGNRVTVISGDIKGHPNDKGYYRLGDVPIGEQEIYARIRDSKSGTLMVSDRVKVMITKGIVVRADLVLKNDHWTLGWQYYRDENYTKAISEFEKALSETGTGQATDISYSAYNGLGWCYGRGKGDYARAIEYFQKALNNSKDMDARVGLAGAYFSRYKDNADLQEALSQLEVVLAQADDYECAHDKINAVDLHALKAAIYWYMRDVDASRREMDYVKLRLLSANNSTRDLISALETILSDI